jgi:hypothetical protein
VPISPPISAPSRAQTAMVAAARTGKADSVAAPISAVTPAPPRRVNRLPVESDRSPRSRWRDSALSSAAIVAAGVCLGLAASAHDWYLGIVPVAVAVLAIRRREPVAEAAFATTVMVLVAGVALAIVS